MTASDLAGFEPVSTQDVRAPRGLTHAKLVDLVEMSPSIHRLTREGAPWQNQLPAALTATLSVRVALFRKVA